MVFLAWLLTVIFGVPPREKAHPDAKPEAEENTDGLDDWWVSGW